MKKIICLLILASLVLINNGCKTTYNLLGDGIILNSSFVTNSVGNLNDNRSAQVEPKSEVEIVRSINSLEQAIDEITRSLEDLSGAKEGNLSKVINKLDEISKSLTNLNKLTPPPNGIIEEVKSLAEEKPAETVATIIGTPPILAVLVKWGNISINFLFKILLKLLPLLISLAREILSSIKKLFKGKNKQD